MADEIEEARNWRAEIAAIGRQNFEIQEMIRLGFIDLTEQSFDSDKYDAALIALVDAHKELQAINDELSALGDIEQQIKKIRARRIERVKKERELKRAEQAVLAIRKKEEEAERRRISPTFLGRGVSLGLEFRGADSKRLEQLGLPSLESFLDVAQALEIPPETLQWLTYHRASSSTDHYSRFEIPKRSGGKRLISSPKPALRKAQSWISENLLSVLTPSPAAMAFRPGLSIVDNARTHLGSAVVVKLDLKDFFPSITFPRVRNYFQRLGYNSGVASVFALLTTDPPRVRLTMGDEVKFVAVGPRSLPQGAVSSPALANLIAMGLDVRCLALAKKANWTYSRYADDLVFSSKTNDSAPHRLIKTVDTIVQDLGFQLNLDKTRIMRSPRRQIVNGLLLGPDIRLTRKDLRRWRAFLHRCETKGPDVVSEEMGKDALAVAQGFHSYLHMVNPGMAEQLLEKHAWIKAGKK